VVASFLSIYEFVDIFEDFDLVLNFGLHLHLWSVEVVLALRVNFGPMSLSYLTISLRVILLQVNCLKLRYLELFHLLCRLLRGLSRLHLIQGVIGRCVGRDVGVLHKVHFSQVA
jgi:hypothetical protein